MNWVWLWPERNGKTRNGQLGRTESTCGVNKNGVSDLG